MKKSVMVIWNDIYHPSSVIQTSLHKIFCPNEWDVTCTERARDLLEDDVRPDLAVFYTNGRPKGETDLTYAEQDRIAEKVEAGMGILFYHAGLVLIEPDSPFYTRLNSGRFVHHPEQCDVTVTPLGNVRHPITQGVQPFTQNDEHYFCTVDVSRTNVLACASSPSITAVGAWCHTCGRGRVAGITQGHTLEMQNDPNMIRLACNAVQWLTEKEGAAE